MKLFGYEISKAKHTLDSAESRERAEEIRKKNHAIKMQQLEDKERLNTLRREAEIQRIQDSLKGNSSMEEKLISLFDKE